jgi:putative ABC transport system permease protein
MLRLALASVRRSPALFTGQFLTVALASALIAANGEAFTAALTAPNAGSQGMDGAITLLAMGWVVPAFVAVTGLISSTGLTVALRRRDLALLRLIGSSAGQTRRMIIFETVALAVLAGLIGVIIGALGTGPTVSVINSIGLAPVNLTATLNPLPLLIAWAAAVILSVVGALLAARRASTIAPGEALRIADVDAKVMTAGRWVPGTAVGLIGIGMLLMASLDEVKVATRLTTFGSIALAIGAVAWAPVLLPLLARIILAPLRAGVGPRLAAASVSTGRRRTAALAAPVLAAITIIGTISAVLTETDAATGASAAQVTLNNSLLLVLTGPALLYVLIASASAQVMTYSSRRTELLSMRLLGIRRATIVTGSIVESFAAALLGVIGGVIITFASLLAYRTALARTFGHATIALPWAALTVICGSCLIVLVIAGAAAAHRQART